MGLVLMAKPWMGISKSLIWIAELKHGEFGAHFPTENAHVIGLILISGLTIRGVGSQC